MIKIILFDCDGLIVKRNKYFSQRLADLGYKINHEKVAEFFLGEFLECETGKKDLKQVLPNWMPEWGWQGNTEELLKFWFEGESEIDTEVVGTIKTLREKGIKCYLATNNEKHRTEFLWEKVGLKDLLDGLYSSCNVGFLKGQNEFWPELYKNFPSIPKQDILLWDDDMENIHPARQFGLNAELYENFTEYKRIMAEKYQIIL